MREIVELLQSHNELKIIDEELDINLEIPHIAYIEVKKPDSKALLFTHPVDRARGKAFEIPVLMNVFGSFSRLEILAPNYQNLANDIEKLLKFSPPKGFLATLRALKDIARFRHIFPKTTTQAPCQEIILRGESVDLSMLPILKTWEKDGGAFITMGQIYTQSADSKVKNLGMYRLQVYDKRHLGLHWQIHKDSAHSFSEYKRLGRKMPVSVALGGDALYVWCAQAPLPYGMYELMLYGLLRGRKARVCKCVSNDLYVPSDCDIVIEGFVDMEHFRDEGPFGDHTGFYTPIEPYPVLEVSAITMKKSPIYPATVVGKPPLEDKYMGYMTERIFLPMLRATIPALVDYYMPENGVFHNLILAKIAPQYPAHAKQIMHGFWGVGQMSFVKHAIFLPPNAPELTAHKEITAFILNHLDLDSILISQGICDALDHSSPNYASGGKLGVDCTGEAGCENPCEILSDEELLAQIKREYSEVVGLKQHFTHTKNPITLISVQKTSKVLSHIGAFKARNMRIVCVLDANGNDLDNLYMCLWRVSNNIDAARDILIQKPLALIDATAKGAIEGHTRAWPDDVVCTRAVLERLVKLGVIERDEKLWEKYQIL